MKNKYESLADFMKRFGIVLGNAASSPEIAAALLAFGFDETKLAEGRALLDNLIALDEEQVQRYGAQYEATEQLNAAYEQADEAYMMHRRLARMLFKDKGNARKQLQLNHYKPPTRGKWMRQARLFYRNLLENPEFLAQMAALGQTQEALADAQEIVLRVIELDIEQQKAKADAQAATQARDEVWQAGREWLQNFMVVADFALAANPQMKEAFMEVES